MQGPWGELSQMRAKCEPKATLICLFACKDFPVCEKGTVAVPDCLLAKRRERNNTASWASRSPWVVVKLSSFLSICIQCMIEGFLLASLRHLLACDAAAIQANAGFAALHCSTRATALRLWPVFRVYEASMHENDSRAVCVGKK
ncbi:uncharacterized protein TrAtP1_008664 [Trichoderma atroviride]|uniref:uncharacterized protein n=1 Tax=Hypocrea atroviridis TaxID=63577 RepID=UPI00331A6109|nr:hypothetical protein TrAtP1_008664 [Trichoderma atroviride]